MALHKRPYLHFGLELGAAGFIPGAWLKDDTQKLLSDFSYITEQTTKADAILFDLVFLTEEKTALFSNGEGHRLDPVMTSVALATIQPGIGVVAQVSPHRNAPYTAARMLASIDHISHGRGGWLVDPRETDFEARRFGENHHSDAAIEKSRTAEFIEAVNALLDSWEDDAFIRDKKSGQFFDRDKVHFVNFEGKYFRSRGPLDIARPIQGTLPVFLDADSLDDPAFAAAYADVIVHTPRNRAATHAFRQDIDKALQSTGYPQGSKPVLSRVEIIAGRDAAEAAALKNAALENVDAHGVIASIASLFDEEIGQDLNRSIPQSAISSANAGEYRTDVSQGIADARQKGRSLAELALDLVAHQTADHVTFTGSPFEIADELEDWIRTGSSDGFILTLPAVSGALERFSDHVIPALQRRGLYPTERRGTTLREQVDLPRPDNRFAASA